MSCRMLVLDVDTAGPAAQRERERSTRGDRAFFSRVGLFVSLRYGVNEYPSVSLSTGPKLVSGLAE